MFRSYWLLYVAVVGILIGAGGVLAQPVRNDVGGQSNTAKAQDKPQGDETPFALTDIRDAIERLTSAYLARQNKPKSVEEEQITTRDLKAQEGMAWAAKIMIGVGVFESVVTLAGVILVFATLRHTKRAADAAIQAVEETRKATTSSTDSAFQQLRAYVHFERGSVTHEGAETFANVNLRNAGKTPAQRTTVYLWAEYAQGQAAEFSFPIEEATPPIVAFANIAPDSSMPLRIEIGLRGADMAKIDKRLASIFVWGLVKYETFKEPSSYTFRTYVSGHPKNLALNRPGFAGGRLV